MHDASSATDGNASAVTPPVRNFSRRPAIEISSSAASQAGRRRGPVAAARRTPSTSSPMSCAARRPRHPRGALRARSSPSRAARSRALLERAEPGRCARPADRRLERTGTAGDHDVQVQRSVGGRPPARSARSRVADDEAADQRRRTAPRGGRGAPSRAGRGARCRAGRWRRRRRGRRIEERGTLRWAWLPRYDTAAGWARGVLQIVGDIPRTRHTASRRRRAAPVRGADGGGGLLLRLLAALPPRRPVGDRRQPGVGAARPVARRRTTRSSRGTSSCTTSRRARPPASTR